MSSERISSAERALDRAYSFIIFEPHGPYGDFGSFEPLEVRREPGSWVIKCRFTKRGREKKALVKVDDEGNIVEFSYEQA